jgi:long-subunit acyl-CoA synthetase (AMP-forming)/alkylation response protein AidB-like acyl-CoA dehydrogenase
MNPVATTRRGSAAAPGESAAATLVGLLAARAHDAFDRRAIVDGLAGTAGKDRAAVASAWTWGELAAAAVQLADAFVAAGLDRGDRVAHVGPHTPDWILVDLACLLAGVVHVPLHADAAREEHRAQLAWLAPRGVVFSGNVGPLAPRDVAGRIAIDLTPAGPLAAAGLAGDAWRPFASDAVAVRERLDAFAERCDPEACSAILLSSGTSGVPHGVMHSQRSLAANAVAAAAVFLDDPRDVRLSWLPLSHSLALTGDLGTALVRGGCLNVVRDRSRVLDACRVAPPTVILGVPAFFERLERAAVTGRIPDLAAALGGEVRVCISGGAPLRCRTAELFVARGVPLVQGYGLAEAGPVVTLANPRIARIGTVGPPLPGVEVRLDERAATRGQLLVHSPGRALGVIAPGGEASLPLPGDSGGWLETGDVAEIDADGHVRICGRLGDVLVLATGVKLPPAAVEAALAEDDAVAQVCVVGAGQRRPTAIVVPEPAVLRAAIRRLGLVVVSRRQAVSHPRVQAWLARRLARRQAALPRSWRVKTFVIADRAFDAARGEATASLKPKRGAIERHYRDRVLRAVEASERRGAEEHGSTMNAAAEDRRSWAASALWRAGAGGFAQAAAAAAEPLPDRIEAVLDRAAAEIARLRAEQALYEPLAAEPGPAAPLDDAPPPPFGVLSRETEDTLGDTGLWGLAVPEAWGGAGGSMLDLARAITRLAASVPTAAGTLAVHSSIGVVSAVTGFGSPEQRDRLLPALAAGRPLSIFAATEPDAGCDLGRVATVLESHDERLLLTGTKMFITGATHGRLVKLLAVRAGKPAVVIVRLPDADTPTFRLRRYALHPLKHAHNAALEFTRFEVDPGDVLDPGPTGDALRIVWHGLNRGRVTLAAQAAGTLRLLLAQARAQAARRLTWDRPIASRQLIQGRLGRIAAATVACDALAAWAASAIDAGQSGEWEAITAKVVASHCVRDAAIDALGVHGGRAFLVGHPLGDSLHDHFAVTVYEGESDLLGLALFKGLAKHHPLAAAGREAAAWQRAGNWLAWRVAAAAGGFGRDAALLDRGLRGHAAAARKRLARLAVAIDRAIRRHGRALAERQLEVGVLSGAVRDALSVLAVAHHADASGDDALLVAAEAWCRLALARASGRLPAAAALAAVARAGESR